MIDPLMNYLMIIISTMVVIIVITQVLASYSKGVKALKKNWLVFEAQYMPEMRNGSGGRNLPERNEFGHIRPELVRAGDEQEAAMKVAKRTRRFANYAVVPVTLVSLIPKDEEDEEDPWDITPDIGLLGAASSQESS